MYMLQSNFTIERYVADDGDVPFDKWFDDVRDRKARARIRQRLDRLSIGIFGDCKPLRVGVWELRIDYGPGYRVYYSIVSKAVILLLCGGDKRKQNADIERAVNYLQHYRQR